MQIVLISFSFCEHCKLTFPVLSVYIINMASYPDPDMDENDL